MKSGTSVASGAVVLVMCTVMAMFMTPDQVSSLKKNNEAPLKDSQVKIGETKTDYSTESNKRAEPKESPRIEEKKKKDPPPSNNEKPDGNWNWWGSQGSQTADQINPSSPGRSSLKFPSSFGEVTDLVPSWKDLSEGRLEVPTNSFSIAQTGLKILILVFVMLEILLLKDKIQGLEEKATKESLIERQMWELEKEKLNVQKNRLEHDLERTQEKIDKYTADSRKLEIQLRDLDSPISNGPSPVSVGPSKDIVS